MAREGSPAPAAEDVRGRGPHSRQSTYQDIPLLDHALTVELDVGRADALSLFLRDGTRRITCKIRW